MAVADIEDQDEREDVYCHVREIELSRNDAIEEADRVLAEIVRANRRATSGELCYFQSELRWDERQVKAELRRMMNVLRLRGIAGTAADRAAASVEADTAAAVLAKEGPKLQAKIDELEAKLRSLDADARLSAKRQADQTEAVEGLRALAPTHIRESVRHRENELGIGLGKKLSDAEIRFNELCCNLDPSKYPTEAAYLESLRTSCREAIEDFVLGGFLRFRLSKDWPSIRVKLEAERERLEKEIAELKKEIAEQESAIRQQLDYYVKGSKDDR